MKKFQHFCLAGVLVSSLSMCSSSKDAQDGEVKETEPVFPGGNEAMMSFIRSETEYPGSARKAGIEQKVMVECVVNKDGSLSDIRVVNEVHESLRKEAIRVIREMPDWKPGMQEGEPVRVRVRIPIRFHLEE